MKEKKIKNIYDSKQEQKFFEKFKLEKNSKRFYYWKFINPLVRDLYCVPDYLNEKKKLIIEFKGYHKNIRAYRIQNKLMREFCYLNDYRLVEVKYKKGKYYFLIGKTEFEFTQNFLDRFLGK